MRRPRHKCLSSAIAPKPEITSKHVVLSKTILDVAWSRNPQEVLLAVADPAESHFLNDSKPSSTSPNHLRKDVTCLNDNSTVVLDVTCLAPGTASLHAHLVRQFSLAEAAAVGPTSISSILCVNLSRVEQQHKLWTRLLPRVRPFYAVKAHPDPLATTLPQSFLPQSYQVPLWSTF